MAQYEEAASNVLSEIASSGLSGSTKDALESIIGSTGNVTLQAYEGTAVAAGTKIVTVGAGVTLNSDPGGEVIIMAADAPGANVTFSADTARVVVGSGNADTMTFAGNANVTVETGGGNDSVTTGGGSDQVVANGVGDVTVNTGAGNDVVVLQGEGARVIDLGGSGDNVVILESGSVTATITGGNGFDQVQINEGRGAHEFSIVNGKVVMHSANPTTMDNVDVIHFTGDQVTVVADSHAESVVAKLYRVAFDRDADVEGVNFWMDFLDNGNSLEHTVYSFINSAEFQRLHGSESNQAFITSLYQNLADREPDAAGLAYWMNEMNSGATHADVAWAFAESAEATKVLGIDGDQYVIDMF